MATLSAVTTPTINVPNNREQTNARDTSNLRDKLSGSTTQPANESLAKTDADTQKNYSQQQDFITSSKVDPSTLQNGNRRGNLLDLTV